MTSLPEGTIDLHVHAAPDGGARCVDALGLARAGGIAGAVFKCHHAPTAGIAALVRQEVPGFRAFGGLVLNHAVGGLNPAAVEAAALVGGGAACLVWLPTRDAQNDLRRKRRAGLPVTVTEGGRPVPAVFALVEAAEVHRMILASGHLDPAETVAVFAALAPTGLPRIATHVTAGVTPFAAEQVAAVLRTGALVEICARNLLVRRAHRAETDMDRVAAAAALIRRFGAPNFVLSSDLGDPRYPQPVAGLAAVVASLALAGITDAALEAMLVTTPQTLWPTLPPEMTPDE